MRHNIDYLTIRERQEYYELLNELKKKEIILNLKNLKNIQNQNIPIMNQKIFNKEIWNHPLITTILIEEIHESSPSPEKNRNKISTGNKGSKR